MLEVIYYVAASLDGFIATPDGSVDWLASFENSAEDYGYREFLDSVDAIVMGSRTYEQVIGFDMPWPYEGHGTWVLTHRDLEIRPGVTLTADPPGMVAAQLEALGHKRAWLVGGGALASAFRAEGLITACIVSVMPVILGEGVPVFGATGEADGLTLTKCERFDSGVIQLWYAVEPR